jgi:type II secretory pathway pseudopilin PulG
VIPPEQRPSDRGNPAFSLIETIAVIAILVILMAAGASLMKGTGTQARNAGADMLGGMIEQARASAITSRCYVVLAIAEPGDLPTSDERCRLGLFKVAVDKWPMAPSDTAEAELMSRWRTLETGVALIGGNVDGVPNPLDGDELTISYGANKPIAVRVHAIAFNPRGGLHYPSGSTPVAMRVAEGSYQKRKATAYQRGDTGVISENRLKIGRVIARPYRIDG